MKSLKSLLILIVILFSTITSAQITSSTLSGKVTDGDKPIVNATITIIHLPTNASFDTTTDKKGRFSIDNLDVGGPYRLVIKSDEIAEYKRNNIQLILGDNEMTRDIIVNRKQSNANDASKAEGVGNMQ
ncbi:MAG TPA: carboxypeptidase-like regulatory domain-containing protein [Flavobacterium sp.]|uniref:carboxypeptidase-like regulatory domain-containing protein n=1 Tax=Flavobacterium sp. TaxID=239 RepID=UPI002BAAEB6A|nr:carboxypeptidase-like regulatory domain-containing protein [Flavobacterium sp.]HNP32895.1 carboxypeptidase-like regulatory domain-containing protein [Flavobacterium sp.]